MTACQITLVRSQVLQLWQIEDYRRAAEVAEQAAVEFPWDGHLWELAGLAARKLGDIARATAALETANSLVPLSSVAQCALAGCYLAEGKRDAARVILTHLATQANCPTDCLAELAGNLGRIGATELALRTCRLASQREPDRDEPLYGMAYYMRRLGYPTEMIAAVVARAHRLDPRSAIYRVALAILYAELHRLEDAYPLVGNLCIERLSCGHCLSKLARVFLAAGDDMGAARCDTRRRALEVDREDQSWTPPCGPC